MANICSPPSPPALLPVVIVRLNHPGLLTVPLVGLLLEGWSGLYSPQSLQSPDRLALV